MRHAATLLGLGLLVLAACATPYVQSATDFAANPVLVMGDDGTPAAVRASDGMELPLRVWAAHEEPLAIVVGIHGFNDYSATFDAPGRWWSKRGIWTFAYDQRGFGAGPEFGTWPGPDLLVRDLEDVVTAIRERHPHVPVYLYGNSMGAAVVLVALQRAGPASSLSSVSAASLTAPAVWGGSAMNVFFRASLWLAAHTFPAHHVTGRGLAVLPSDNIEMLRALGRDPLIIKETRIDAVYGLVSLMGAGQSAAFDVGIRLLIQYGARDEIIPRGPTARLASQLANRARFAVYPNGYHMLLRGLQAEVVWRDVATWIHDGAAPLPSGAEVSGTDLFAGLIR